MSGLTSSDLLAATRLDDTLCAEYLEFNAVLPIRRDEDRMIVATWIESVDEQTLDELSVHFGAEIELIRLGEGDIRPAIRRLYGAEASAESFIAGMQVETRATSGEDSALDDLVHQANEAPVIRLVNLLLLEALEARASDVHLESYSDGLRSRYRIDGVMQDAPTPPAHLAAAIVSRLKIMAELDIAERRLPQDGRIRLRLLDRQVDVRVSTLPTLHGESVVLRLLDKEEGRVGLAELGMAADTLGRFTEVISRPHGIVLATGPTGSGKTTSLYAAIEIIRTGREKILTVEDPVEYQLAGVPQVAVNEKVGVTFATALRALLRQDPDVMLVGEIRDGETAEIATQAALTGHLVLSTLHTNDAASALTRLLELEVAPYLVASTVEAVLAQRLVRRICLSCRERVVADPSWQQAMGGDAGDSFTWRGVGCAACRGTGYRGRIGIYELLVLDEELRAEVLLRRGAEALRQLAIRKGMRTLREDGVRQVMAGLTTTEEILRVTKA